MSLNQSHEHTRIKDSNGLVKSISWHILNKRGHVQWVEEREGNDVKVHVAKHVRKYSRIIILNNIFSFGQRKEVWKSEILFHNYEIQIKPMTCMSMHTHTNALQVTGGEVWVKVYCYHFICKTFLQDTLDF